MKDFRKTYISLIIIHVVITIGFALVFGTNHPFSSQYIIADLYPIITSSATLATLLYVLGGYLFVIAKENKSRLFSKVALASLIFTLILMIIWAVTRTLSINGAQRNIWLIYVIANYPTAIIFNSIMNIEDLHAIELVLTSIPPAIGFMIGSFIRLICEPQWRKK